MSKNIFAVMFIIGAIIVFWFWINPYLNEIDLLNFEKEAYEDALGRSRQAQASRDYLIQKINSVSAEELSYLNKIVTKDPEETMLMVELANVASETGVVIKSFDTKKEKPQTLGVNLKTKMLLEEPKYYSLTLEMTLLASYESFRLFLEETQRSLRLIDVEEIEFISGDTNIYGFDILATAYYKKNE